MLTRLTEIQAANGWDDAAMAARLGISRPAWNGIRNGKLRLSERVQMAAARAFPELLGFLVTSVTVSATQADTEAVA